MQRTFRTRHYTNIQESGDIQESDDIQESGVGGTKVEMPTIDDIHYMEEGDEHREDEF